MTVKGLGRRQLLILKFFNDRRRISNNLMSVSVSEISKRCGFVDNWGIVHRSNCRAALTALRRRGLLKLEAQGKPKGSTSSTWSLTEKGMEVLHG